MGRMGCFTDSWTGWLGWLDDFWISGEVLGEVGDGVSIAAPRLEFTWVVMGLGTGEVVILGAIVMDGVMDFSVGVGLLGDGIVAVDL